MLASIRESGVAAASHDRHFAVNSRAVAILTALFARRIIARQAHWGRIINISLEKALIADIPMRRIGRPQDIADAVVFFASKQVCWITGQLLFVHGGHRMALGQS